MVRSTTVIWLISLLVLSVIAAGASLVSVTGQYETVDGGYRYGLTLQNTSEPLLDLHVSMFTVYLVGWPYTQVDSPPSWESSTRTYNVLWETSAVPSATWGEGVPPGRTLAGFSFTSPVLVTSMGYHVWMSNGTDEDGEGGTVTVSLLPEPSALLALGAGGLGLLGAARRRRRTG